MSEFRQQVARRRDRHTRLRQGPAETVAQNPGQALTALDEAWEELATADEELQTRSEQLGEAQAQLLAEQRRYQRLFDFAPEACLVTDRLGKIIQANRAAQEMLDEIKGPLAGRLLLSLVCLRDRNLVRTHLREVSASTGARRWECTLVSAPLRVVAVTLGVDDEGELLWSLRDVTEQKHQERLVRSLHEELERRVRARTRELEASRQVVEELLQRERQLRQPPEREKSDGREPRAPGPEQDQAGVADAPPRPAPTGPP